jgi:ABC-type transport system involved in multi-copper enzyme maturation permease subunit
MFFNLLVSDFYRIFKRKAFYICLLLTMAYAVIDIFTLGYQIGSPYGMPDLDLKMLGYNGFMVLTRGVSNITIFLSVFVSMFIATEFSTSTIHNVLIRGCNKIVVYASKLVSVLCTLVFFSLFCCAASFASGCYLWGIGNLTNEILFSSLKSLGMYIFSASAFYSLIVMLGFLIRNSAGVIGVTMAVSLGILDLVIYGIMYILHTWFGLSNINLFDYWITYYLKAAVPMPDQLARVIITISSYIILSTAIGMFSFWKRDNK